MPTNNSTMDDQVITELKSMFGNNLTSGDIRGFCASRNLNYQTVTRRLENFKIAYKYLRETFKTNIIIYESGVKSNLEKLIENDTTYFFEKNDCRTFHRTRYLNFMLNIVNNANTTTNRI